MKDLFRVRRMWRPAAELKARYDVVIVGGGSHGLATAYYLAKNHGITDVAILEKNYIGSGAAGRNTTIIRANYRTPEGAEFYKESVRLYERLGADLDFNLLFSQQGHLTLAHSDRGIITANERAEVNKLLGIDSRVIYPDEIRKLCPEMDLSDDVTWPVQRPFTTRRAGSSATTRSSGASPAQPTARARRSIRIPRSPGSGARTGE